MLNGIPRTSIGTVGTYATDATVRTNPIFYKNDTNVWVKVGSTDWQDAIVTIKGVTPSPSALVAGKTLVINGTTITTTGTSVTSVATDINHANIQGVSASVSLVDQLEIRINSTSSSIGNVLSPDGKIKIEKGASGTDCAQTLGLFTSAEASLTSKTLNAPALQFSDYRNVPAWRKGDQTPRPYGSVWVKTSVTGLGANWVIKQYSATLDSWVQKAAPLYHNDFDAIYAMDPVSGGGKIARNAIYIQYDVDQDNTTSFKPFFKNVTGLLKITSRTPSIATPFVFNSGDAFKIEVNVPNSTLLHSANITLTGTTPEEFVADILAASLPNLVVVIESSGAISISHSAGGAIKFTNLLGTSLDNSGLMSHTQVRALPTIGEYIASPFVQLDYTYAETAPYSNPLDGTLWYDNNALSVDIMVHDGAGWKGYKNVPNDARGYDLSLTDTSGPILSASAPISHVDGTNLVPGDLWIDTGDLENYPVIYRYNNLSTWDLIDNKDDISVDGIVFADARWDLDGAVNPVTSNLVSIDALRTSDRIDADAPDYRLYARGTLLFNTRRSGFTVKKFESKYHANANPLPAELGAWVNASGKDANGVPYFGHKAQRNIIVEAMKAAIETSTDLREEQLEFNLMVCPGYPELIQNMVTLNNDRKNTAFIIGDSPLTLNSSSQSVQTWAKNTNLAVDNSTDGLVTHDPYLAVYYPAGYTSNLDGNSVVVPASHLMLRTFIRSDNVSYPWFAPAGVRRGVIDNASSIGYVDTTDNSTFRSIGVTQALRDILYENEVNPITVLPGVGVVAYGQKTRSSMTSSMDRVNVARLVCYLRLVLDKVARPFIFEPNDEITRKQVKSAFEAVLNDIVAKRGIYDYLVVVDSSNNTPDRIDRNELWIDIAIEPVKAIEFIYIPVRLKNTGAIAKGL